MKSRMRITLIGLVIVATLAGFLAIWSNIDPALLSQITGSAWVIGLAAIAIGYLSQEHLPHKDHY